MCVGTAEWEGGSKGPKSEALIYWHTPEEWANLVWNWVSFGTCVRVKKKAKLYMHRLMRRDKITKL